jgi:uncharacterized OB-fold protein
MVILAVAIAVASVPSIDIHKVFATSYEKSQTITQTNECGNYWFPINVICSNLGSQIQGGENSVTVDAVADQEKENVEDSESFAPFP